MIDTKQYPPLNLPKVAAETAKLYNAISRRMRELSVPLGNGTLNVHLAYSADPVTPVVRISLQIRNEHWNLDLSGIDFVRMHPVLANHPEIDVQVMPAELTGAIIESLISPLALALQNLLGAPVTIENILVDSIKTPSRAAGGIGFTLDFSETNASLFAYLHPDVPLTAMHLAEMLIAVPRKPGAMLHANLGQVPVNVVISAGALRLPKEEFSSLNLGDVIIPSQWLPATGAAQLELYCGNRAFGRAMCRIANGNGEVVEEMNYLGQGSEEDAQSIDVRMDFALEERSVSVSRLHSLGAGYTFSLTASNDTLIVIRANGKRIARGRVIDLNGTVGVEIVQSL